MYASWPPYGERGDKHLVFRDVELWVAPLLVQPQVTVLLARWYDPARHDRWSTTATVPGNGVSCRLRARVVGHVGQHLAPRRSSTGCVVPLCGDTLVHSLIEVPGPHGLLKGVLLAPSGSNAPIALLIPGSGPTDRDGDRPLGIRAASYRLLAAALAGCRIATVGIDKRGLFASGGAVPDADAVTMGDYVDDVRRWVAVVRDITGARRVWLSGHSEGGLVAWTAANAVEDACGVIAIATPGYPPGDVLRRQLRAESWMFRRNVRFPESGR